MPPRPVRPGHWLREQFRRPKPLRAPGVYDALSARQAAGLGFELVYVSGGATAAGRGFPDMGITGLMEVVEQARLITGASGLPAVVDGDTGFGSLPALRRLIWELESAGAAAVHIEDQPHHRRCGFIKGEPAISIAEMRDRISAARKAASDIVVIARLDCLLYEGLDAALERVPEYEAAGAEMIFVNGITGLDQLERIAEVASGPLLHNFSGSDLSPNVSDELAAELNVKAVIYPIHAARAAAKAATQVLTHIARGEPIPSEEMMPFKEFFDLAGWSETEAFEREVLEPGSP